MKACYALLALTVAAANALAQTLVPVASGGFDFWPLVIVAVIAAIGAGLFIWHKRNPSKADTAIADAKNELIAGWHKASDQVSSLTKTVALQNVVLSSPPVQAAINAPAAAAAPPPAAQARLGATIAPPSVSQAVPPAAAAQTAAVEPYTGPFLNHDGKPDPLGQYTAETLKNELNWESTRETPSMPDSVSNQVLATFDAEPDVWIKWYHISAKEQLALVNRMTQAQQAANINEYNGANGRNIGVPPGWAESACHRLRGD